MSTGEPQMMRMEGCRPQIMQAVRRRISDVPCRQQFGFGYRELLFQSWLVISCGKGRGGVAAARLGFCLILPQQVCHGAMVALTVVMQ